MIRPVKKYSSITTNFGSSPDTGVFGKHAGTDYAVPIDTPVYSPVTGRVTQSFKGVTGHLVEVTVNGKSHRMLHMSSRLVLTGDSVKEGQQIGYSGSTYGYPGAGPHLHWDVRKAGTAYNHSFDDYWNPELLLEQAQQAAAAAAIKHPYQWAVGKRVYLSKNAPTWRVYKPGTRTVVGTLLPKANGGLSYVVRDVDRPLPNRVIIYSGTFGRVSLPIDSDAVIK